nr:hypothetical protein [uncultured Roseateles sp.]
MNDPLPRWARRPTSLADPSPVPPWRWRWLRFDAPGNHVVLTLADRRHVRYERPRPPTTDDQASAR